MAFFIAFFAAAVGGFITLVLRLLYERTALPVWAIPLVAAIIAGSAFTVNEQYGFYVLVGLFVLTFVLFQVAFFYRSFSGLRERFIKERQKNQSMLKTILKFVGSLLVVVIFYGALVYGPIAFVGVILLSVIISWLTPTTKGQFFKLQQILPTSKIRSLAMGLVEVEGIVSASEQVTAPLSKKKCIGYYYAQYEISTDSDGDRHYHLLSVAEKYQPFKITDDTGGVAVVPDGLELVSFTPSAEEERGGRRYTEYALFNNERVMLIGAANERNNQVVIIKDTVKDILAISPVTSVSRWNRSRPLVNTALMFCGVAAFLIAVILTIPYTFDGHILTLNFWQSPFFSWLKP
ncbi:hypothetical protein [Chania multitudinisentens]|nr:hypothetical protein [Chania multitudinisentens]